LKNRNFDNLQILILIFDFLKKYGNKYDKKTRVNFKTFGEEISQKIDRFHIYDLNLLKFAFFI
jgi:hypothetical protein